MSAFVTGVVIAGWCVSSLEPEASAPFLIEAHIYASQPMLYVHCTDLYA